MNKYVKLKGYEGAWYLLYEQGTNDFELNERMKTQMYRSQICKLHNNTPKSRKDIQFVATLKAVENIDYERASEKIGTILIQKNGSFMPLRGNEIILEYYSPHFPIEDHAEIVICENDEKPEWDWLEYLQKRFPNKTITTINYFDQRSDCEIIEYFHKAKYVTFSTTFSKFDWFEKLSKNICVHNKIIGYSSDESKWQEAIDIHGPNMEIILYKDLQEKVPDIIFSTIISRALKKIIV